MIRRLICVLIYFAIFLTPFLYLPSLLEMTTRGAGLAAGRDLIAMKAAKDILLLAVFFLFLLDVVSGRAFIADRFVWFLVTGIGLSFCVSLYRSGPVLALIGLRSISPFVLMFISYRYIDKKALGTIVAVLGVLLLVESAAAIVRALYGVPVDGRTYFGLVARPSGTFASPTSWSVFITLTVSYILGLDISRYGRPRRRTWFLVVWAGLLVFLAAAGAGLFAFAGLLVSYVLFLSRSHRFLKAAILPFMLLIPLLILSNLALLTNRELAYNSVKIRSGIIFELLSSMDLREVLVGKGLGVGSDVALTVRYLHPEILSGVDDLYYSDSLYAALLGQTGFIFTGVFLIFNVRMFAGAVKTRRHGVSPIVILALPAVLAGAAGSVMTEVFPVNWLLFILYGMALRERDLVACEGDGCARPDTLRLESFGGLA